MDVFYHFKFLPKQKKSLQVIVASQNACIKMEMSYNSIFCLPIYLFLHFAIPFVKCLRKKGPKIFRLPPESRLSSEIGSVKVASHQLVQDSFISLVFLLISKITNERKDQALRSVLFIGSPIKFIGRIQIVLDLHLGKDFLWYAKRWLGRIYSQFCF